MADVRRLVVEKARDTRLVDAVLGYLEEIMSSGSEDIIEIIAVSFLENMNPAEPSYEALSCRMGPLLRAELARLRVLWKDATPQRHDRTEHDRRRRESR